MMDAVEALGFTLYEAENAKASGFGSSGFVQEFEYRPTRGSRYANDLDEIELFPTARGDSLDVRVEVDEAGRSLLGSDESHHEMTLSTTDVEAVTREIESVIDGQL